MADALVSVVLEQFISYVQQEVELAAGVREEVHKLSVTLRMIQGVLEDAERKQVQDSYVKIWLQELKGILYDADDVMDNWNTKIIVSQLPRVDLDGNNPRRMEKVLYYMLSPFSCIVNVSVRFTIGHQIKNIRGKLDEISNRKNQFGLRISSSHIQAQRVTSSIVDVSKVCGREDDKEKVVSRLLGETSRQEVGIHVVSIVGMGGFGKTTLAKLILKDERVAKSFEKMMWVCVSEPFDLIRVAKAIIEEAGGEVPASTEWEAMHKGLSMSVCGKRFLLVLDDVWTKDFNQWNQLKLSLDGGASGSRVIVTTRNNEVAHMMGSSHIHNLEKLSENDSWSLLGDIALMGREEDRNKFESTGKEIANKCKGVPLALSTLASLLCEKRTVQSWRDILASDIWELAHMKDFFLPSLFLSYYSLPSVSKQCFLYCAVFPKDTEMEKNLLVKLWMAEGFLGSGRMKELEKVGEEHFDNLAMRSFLQDFERDSNGNITSCKMHDLVHDFAQYLSQGECSNNAEYDCDTVRYLHAEEIGNSFIPKAKKLRTLLYQKGITIELFTKLPSLRVLDLHLNYGLEELPEAVAKLVHLRYLDMSHRRIMELPGAICSLYNLQTLRLNHCNYLHKLPIEIGRLSNLRHLEMERTDALHHLPQSIKKLSSLRTLFKFIVARECKIGDLELLNNLRGSLELKFLGGMTDENDAIRADLKKKKDLRCLTLDWEEFREEQSESVFRVERMFERLEPHEDLEELNVRYYPGSQFPFWFRDSSVLGNIVKMKLYYCKQCTQLPALGMLGSLESLRIYEMGSVKSIGHEFYGLGVNKILGSEIISFPKLRTLALVDMNGLENWELPISKDNKIMPLLCELRLDVCPKLKALPCLGKLESLEVLDIWLPSSVKQPSLGMSDGSNIDVQSVQEEDVLFPNLRELTIGNMSNSDQWSVPFGKFGENMMPFLSDLTIEDSPKLKVLPDLTKINSLMSLQLDGLDKWEGQTEEGRAEEDRFMPSSFSHLTIRECPKLKMVPSYLFSLTLERLEIIRCPELSVSQCLPPLLNSLKLDGNSGVYSKSIPVENGCLINHCTISDHLHSTLPEGFKKLKALRKLEFDWCDHLDFELIELENFTMLEELDIVRCPLLRKRFQGDDWRSILAHAPRISIDFKEIAKRS